MFKDSTPISTDWKDIHELWGDMKRFREGHPHHVFIPADDPGHQYTPARVPRLGWVAYLEVGLGGDEQAREWSITVSNALATYNGDLDPLLTIEGRLAQLQEWNQSCGFKGE